MSLLKWDEATKKFYETGISECVLYPYADGKYGPGVAWNGVTAVTESPEGAEPTKLYANNSVYLTLMSAEELGLTIEAYTYPDAFAACDGSALVEDGMYIGQQTRQIFGLSYKTILGNDEKLNNYNFKLHLVYGCMASPSEKAYNTVNEDPEVEPMSWEVSTTPVSVGTIKVGDKDMVFKPTASIVIDASKYTDETKKANLQALINVLQDATNAELPMPAVVYSYLSTGKAPAESEQS